LSVASDEIKPQALVEQVSDETLLRLKRDKVLIDKDPKYINTLIYELVLPHFDFERMSRWVLGKHWRTSKSNQQKAFTEEFKSLMVRTYANSLREYSEEKISYFPFRGNLETGDVMVRSEIKQPGGIPIPINYQLHLQGDQWKVYDITIDDVSLITNYRSSFSREIRQHGIDKLIKKLSDKNK